MTASSLPLRRILGLFALSAASLGAGVTPASPRDVVAEARAIGARHPATGRALASSPRWVRDGDALASPSFAARSADRVVFHVPTRAQGAAELRAGRLTRPLARISLVGVADVAAIERDGVVGFPDAYLDADVLWIALEDIAEQLVLLRSPSAPTQHEWAIELTPRVVASSRDDRGAVTFVDAAGRGVVRLLAPFAIDAAGLRREASLDVAFVAGTPPRATVSVAVDTTGLTFPVLLDPPMEVVSWTELTPATSPPPRGNGAAAFDGARGRVVLHGGNPDNPNNLLGDTWEWDGTTWTDMTPQSSSAKGPKRALHQLAYDAAAQRTVLYGENTFVSGTTTPLWTWDGKAWAGSSSLGPGGRQAPAMTYDAARDALVAFGGNSGDLPDSRVWELTLGGAWKKTLPLSGPGPRWGAAMVFDSKRNLSVMFGGQLVTPMGAYLDDTAEWNGTDWASLILSSGPEPRAFMGAAFDQQRGVTVIFGGESLKGSAPTLYGDTWEWAGTAWTQRMVATAPPGRGGPAMTYDAARKEVFLFGGFAIKGNAGIALADTWVYRSPGGTCVTSDECQGATCLDGVCCGASACGACEACNVPGSIGLCAPIVSADDPDSCTGASTCDAQGACLAKPGRPCADEKACASGFCADGVCCDRACTGRCDACSAAHGASTSGVCTPATKGSPGTPSCAPYVCGGADACATSCVVDADCATGSRCSSGACVPAEAKTATCADAVTLVGADGARHSCAPYRCAAGACSATCSTSDDCSSGAACTASGRCDAAPAAAAPSSSGGCSVTDLEASGNGGWLAAALAALVRARRSRTRTATERARCRR